jgi:protein-tyrosine-phosphatase
MDIETDGLRRRAAKHAALADPARLLIVETLSLGDASPSELQAILSMPSNLLAHHLRVLAREGMLIRSRSEADRRRTYVRLAPGALEDVVPGQVRIAARVVFICTANSARSQLAAALWRRASAIPVASAGTHPAARIHPGAVAVARRRGVPLRIARPRPLDDVVSPGDLIVTVCDNAHEELAAGERSGDPGLHWSVPDPVPAGTDTAFDDTFTELTRRVGDLAERLHIC